MIEQNSQKLSPNALASGVPKIKAQTIEAAPDSRKIGNWIMVACCVPMVIGGGFLFYGLGADASWSARISTLAPLAICVGAHFFMHKLMGHACHDTKSASKNTQGHTDEKTS